MDMVSPNQANHRRAFTFSLSNHFELYLEINVGQKGEVSAKPKERGINFFGFLFTLLNFIY